jgi:hypothetical protein
MLGIFTAKYPDNRTYVFQIITHQASSGLKPIFDRSRITPALRPGFKVRMLTGALAQIKDSEGSKHGNHA